MTTRQILGVVVKGRRGRSRLLGVELLDDVEPTGEQLDTLREAARAWATMTSRDFARLPAEMTIAGVRVRLITPKPTILDRVEPARPVLELVVLVIVALLVSKLGGAIIGYVWDHV